MRSSLCVSQETKEGKKLIIYAVSTVQESTFNSRLFGSKVQRHLSFDCDEMTMSEAPPPAPSTGLPMKRFKFIWRFFLLSNLALAAFMFAKTKRRDSMETNRKAAHKLHKSKATVEGPPEPITSSMDLNYDDFVAPVATPVALRTPIPEEQQREIFKWMLEEKRKVKPKDAVEKKHIDEEKAILKQLLRSSSIPKI